MRTLRVVVLAEHVETLLLCRGAGSRGLNSRALERAVHAFVTPVLLWPTRLDALGHDAQPDPPDRQARETGRAGARERHAVVGAQPLGQAVAAKHSLEGGPCLRTPCARQRPTVEQVARAVIHDGQGVAPALIPGEKLPLEVSTPQRIGRLDAIDDAAKGGHPPAKAPGCDQAGSFEDSSPMPCG